MFAVDRSKANFGMAISSVTRLKLARSRAPILAFASSPTRGFGIFLCGQPILGVPDPAVETDVKPRLPQNVILHRERYAPPDPALLAALDQRLREFQAAQKMQVTDWTEQSALRVRDEAALTGREGIEGLST